MSDATKDINYLKGLVEGSNLADKSEEGKIIVSLINAVSELGDEVDRLKEEVIELSQFRDDLDRSFSEAERFMDAVLGDGPVGEDGFLEYLENTYGDLEDDSEAELDLYDVECPHCNSSFRVDFMDFLEDNVVCPECGEKYVLSDEVIEKLVKNNFEDE